MIKEFVDAFEAKKADLEVSIRNKRIEDYKDLVTRVIELINSNEDYNLPDPKRIHDIDDGNYQGTLVFIIAEPGYQPSNYWYVKVFYGSCSGCDTLQSIQRYSNEPINDEQVKDYMTLALHIIQGLKKMSDDIA